MLLVQRNGLPSCAVKLQHMMSVVAFLRPLCRIRNRIGLTNACTKATCRATCGHGTQLDVCLLAGPLLLSTWFAWTHIARHSYKLELDDINIELYINVYDIDKTYTSSIWIRYSLSIYTVSIASKELFFPEARPLL